MPYYNSHVLCAFASNLLSAAGMPQERASVVAELLVDADLMGHSSHGLNLLPLYLTALTDGAMSKNGDPEILKDSGVIQLWDGNYLSGHWLVWNALETAIPRASHHGIAIVVIRRSYHIGCLSSYLQRATDQGKMIIVATSDPGSSDVAPPGSYSPVYGTNPIAVGIPTNGDPILIDMSTSTTSVGVASNARVHQNKLAGMWLIGNNGQLTDDPTVLLSDPPGAILPLGGKDLGYKGFALALMVDALTVALGGLGRRGFAPHGGASVFIKIIDPDAFGGLSEFYQEVSLLQDACRRAPVVPGCDAVRIPGERALEYKKNALLEGVHLSSNIIENLTSWAMQFRIKPPKPSERKYTV